jgi:steroid 5-alpha reductase family enzyme
MTPLTLVILLAFGLSVMMALAWAVAVWSGKSGWIDVFWTFAVGLGGVAGSLLPVNDVGAFALRQWLVAALCAAWSLRLGHYIAVRSVRRGDDPRYAQMRQDWGDDFGRKLFWLLQLQVAAALVLAISIAIGAHRPVQGLVMTDILGGIILVAAVFGEGLADRQLERFSADPANKGRVCDIGLWRVSRHPNYFFEWLVWVACATIAVDISGGYRPGWLALAAPLQMYWLLVHVSGIPPLEAHMLRSRGDRFREYQRRVNAFWPGPPKASLSGQQAGGSQ